MDDLKQSVAGFKLTGSWREVVELGERITVALQREDVSGADFEDWEDWRPKVEERLEEDVSEKTAEKASVSEGAGERRGEEATDDLETAGERLEEAYESLNDSDDDPVKKAQDTIAHAKRAADTAGRKVIRTVEDTVYRGVMTKFSPYYFDNELVSANLSRDAGFSGDGYEYVFEVNVNDDDLKERVSEHLDDLSELERWHVSTPKDTSRVEEVENVEPVEQSGPNRANHHDI